MMSVRDGLSQTVGRLTPMENRRYHRCPPRARWLHDLLLESARTEWLWPFPVERVVQIPDGYGHDGFISEPASTDVRHEAELSQYVQSEYDL